MNDPCTEDPWYDEVGCDAHPDGVHRCRYGDDVDHVCFGHRRSHQCLCGAQVIEDRSREAS